MKKSRSGFTLIELVVVIVLMGILVATAVPKFMNLSAEAKQAADDGWVAGLRASTVLLYASNAIAGSNVPHATVSNYWPTKADVEGNMQYTNYTRQYYSAFTYDVTNGTWDTTGP